jgi:hypothetical protein
MDEVASLVPTVVSGGDPFEKVTDVGANVVKLGLNPFDND